MKLLGHILCLCLTLALAWAGHHGGSHGSGGGGGHGGHGGGGRHAVDRCEGVEMDAVTTNEEGVPHFFKGAYVYTGFQGRAALANESFAGLVDHLELGHIDAAYRFHCEENLDEHDHLNLFLDDKVYRFHKHKLEEGYPKTIAEAYPGIPDHLDAAVECPKSDCVKDSVIFFKDANIYHYDVNTKAVEVKEFSSMPNCTSAFRYLNHYYCFHGHQFSKFDPKTGDVPAAYPKEARDYFMRCATYSEESDHEERELCTRVPMDAITSDDSGNMYVFRGHFFLHKDANASDDASARANANAGVDAGDDASARANADVGVDASARANADASARANADAGVDASARANANAGVDASARANADAGDDASARANSRTNAIADWKAASIESAFPEVHSEVDTVYSYENKLYIIKGDNLYGYRIGKPNALLDGYPKSVRAELGVEGPLDAAFVCRGSTLHIIKGQEMYDVDLAATQRSAANQRTITLSRVNTAMCRNGEILAVAGNHFYKYASPMIFSTAKSIPEQHRVSQELLGCDH